MLWTSIEIWSCFCLPGAKQLTLFVLADRNCAAPLENFWRPHFITLPFISFYYSACFLIFLSAWYALSTLSFHFFPFFFYFHSRWWSHIPHGSAIWNSFPDSFLLSFVFILGLYVLMFLLIKQSNLMPRGFQFFSAQSFSPRHKALPILWCTRLCCDLCLLLDTEDLFQRHLITFLSLILIQDNTSGRIFLFSTPFLISAGFTDLKLVYV